MRCPKSCFFTSSCWWYLKLKASNHRLHKPSLVEHYLLFVHFTRMRVYARRVVRKTKAWATNTCAGREVVVVERWRALFKLPCLCAAAAAYWYYPKDSAFLQLFVPSPAKFHLTRHHWLTPSPSRVNSPSPSRSSLPPTSPTLSSGE